MSLSTMFAHPQVLSFCGLASLAAWEPVRRSGVPPSSERFGRRTGAEAERRSFTCAPMRVTCFFISLAETTGRNSLIRIQKVSKTTINHSTASTAKEPAVFCTPSAPHFAPISRPLLGVPRPVPSRPERGTRMFGWDCCGGAQRSTR